VWAACGADGHFLTPDGEQLVTFYSAEDPNEAFEVLRDAFNNKVAPGEDAEEE